MLYLNRIVSYVPPNRRTVAELANELRLAPNLAAIYQKVYELREIAYAGKEGIEGLLDNVLERLFADGDVNPKQIKYVFHCRSMTSVCPPGVDLFGRLRKKYGLRHAVMVGVSQDQCATALTALTLAEAVLAHEDDDAKVLILTGEVAFHWRLRHLPNATIVGDAAAACLVGKTGERNAVVSTARRRFEHALNQPVGDHLGIPITNYADDLSGLIKDAVSSASLRIDDISQILIHNVNSISWKLFARRFPCSPDILYMDNVGRFGHCYGSDAFINYCDAVAQGRLKIGDYFIMVAISTNSSFVAAVLKH